MPAGLRRLPLEKPIYEIEDRIAALESAPLGGQQEEELRRLKRELVEVQKKVFGGLDPQTVAEQDRRASRVARLEVGDLSGHPGGLGRPFTTDFGDGQRHPHPLLQPATDHDRKTAGIVSAKLEAESTSRHADHRVERPTDHLEGLARQEAVGRIDAVDLREQLPGHANGHRDRRQSIAWGDDIGWQEKILLGVDHRAGELPEEFLEPLTFLEAERRIVVPGREHRQSLGVTAVGEFVVGVGPSRGER